MIRRSKECVINVPTADLIDQVVGIGNTSGRDVDKFKRFKLTPVPGSEVNTPLIEECYANFECRLADSKLISKYGVFIWEVVKAHVATSPKYPETLHYRGEWSVHACGTNDQSSPEVQTSEPLTGDFPWD